MLQAAIEGGGIRPNIEVRSETVTPPSLRGRFLRTLGSAGLALSSLIIACSPDAKAGTIPSQPEPRATATAIGVGAELVKTGNAEIDTIGDLLANEATRGQVQESDILKWNEAQTAKAAATATAEAQKPAPTPKPKVEAFDCGILSPEACATGEYIQWTFISDGTTVYGMGYRLKGGESIKIKEDLQVAAVEIQQPNPYHGNRITAARNDGTKYTISGKISAAEGLTRFGKDLPAGTVVATTTDSGEKVFAGFDYDLVIRYPSLEDLQKDNPEQIKYPTKELVIDNTGIGNPPPPNGEPPIFFRR